MSEDEDGRQKRSNSVLQLASFFENIAVSSGRNDTTLRQQSTNKASQKETTNTEKRTGGRTSAQPRTNMVQGHRQHENAASPNQPANIERGEEQQSILPELRPDEQTSAETVQGNTQLEDAVSTGEQQTISQRQTTDGQGSVQPLTNMVQGNRQHQEVTSPNKPAIMKRGKQTISQKSTTDGRLSFQPSMAEGNRQYQDVASPHQSANTKRGEQQVISKIVTETISQKQPDQQTPAQASRGTAQGNTQLKDAASTNEQANIRGREQQKSQQTSVETRRYPIARRRANKAKKPLKNTDDIKSVQDMIKLFKLLNLPSDPENLNLAQMKKEAKAEIQAQSSGSGQYSNGTTGFRVISQAKLRDMSIREKLKKLYSDVDHCLKKFDDISILNEDNEDFSKIHNGQKERLDNPDYHLLVAGESSAGKSTLINLIVGEELFPTDVLHATSTICELKYGEKRRLVAHHKSNENLQPEEIKLKTKGECGKTYQEQIRPYMYLEEDKRQKGSEYQKVELFWPNELLQEGVVIIDTPGVGESPDMDRVLMSYLPFAFAFINVIDVTHAGGLQDDYKKKLREILKITQRHGNAAGYLSKCSLFVGNKWDRIEEDDRDKVKKYVAKELSNCWRDANLSHHIVYISAKESIELQQYGGVTSEFQDLLENIKQMILRAIDIRLYDHWRWLDYVLSRVFKIAESFIRETHSNASKTHERVDSIEKRIRDITSKKDDLNKDIQKKVTHETNNFLWTLGEYVVSSDFQKRFCDWSDSCVPWAGDTWSDTKAAIDMAIKDRLQEFLDQWEGREQYHAQLHNKLVDGFFARLNVLEQELQGGDDARSVTTQVNYLNNRSQMSTTAKILVGATCPLWIPVGLAGFLIGMPVVAGLKVKKTLTEKMKLGNYETTPHDYLKRRCKKFLASSPKVEEIVNEYVVEQMTKTANILAAYFEMIPSLLTAERKMVSQLRKERRSHDEVFKQYQPMRQQSTQIRQKMIPVGIEVSPTTVDARDLDWKQDTASCLGEGEFSLVYRGKLKNGRRERKFDSNKNLDVAVKLFKKPFDDLNSRFYLNEETRLMSLDHRNIVKFYGAIKVNVPDTSSVFKFAFVNKYCNANLKDTIFNGSTLVPAKNDKSKETIVTFLQLAADIAEGLNYIHERGLVHRHLKLENILVDENQSAMIGDIGIVSTFKETERSIIYLAPEVLDDRMNCTKAADVYSFGIVMWEMWHGKQAFTELMPFDKVTFQKKIVAGYRPEQDKSKTSCPGPHTLMKSCWATDPHKRPSVNHCYKNLWGTCVQMKGYKLYESPV